MSAIHFKWFKLYRNTEWEVIYPPCTVGRMKCSEKHHCLLVGSDGKVNALNSYCLGLNPSSTTYQLRYVEQVI